jgi:tRNA-dihydrouridine synthase
MNKGEADWSHIKQVKDHPDIEIPIFGNGDVDSPEKCVANRAAFGVDGVMIGRAAIGYPWIFGDIKHYMETGTHRPPPDLQERVRVCRRHLVTSVDWKGEKVGIQEMRRHYANYFKGMPHFKPLRIKLVTMESLGELLETLDEIATMDFEAVPAL